jgi:protein arginine kinase
VRKNIHDITSNLTLFYPENRHEVITGCRVSLRRNIEEFEFAHQLSRQEQIKIHGLVNVALDKAGILSCYEYVDIKDINNLDIIGKTDRFEFANTFAGAFISKSENIAILVNFEDHICIQAVEHGYSADILFEKVNAIDNLLAESIDFAYSDKLGFLTVSPKYVGTGLSVEVGLHIGGMKFVDEMQQVLFGLDELGFRIRELFGSIESDSSAIGGIIVISNKRTLGVTEDMILDSMSAIAEKLQRLESSARERYFVESSRMVHEQIETFKDERKDGDGKRALSYMLEVASFLKLGIDSGVLQKISYDDIYDILDKSDIRYNLDLCDSSVGDVEGMAVIDNILKKIELVEYIDE